MGTKSLISSIFRNFLALPICYFLTSTMTEFWWGIAASEIIGTAFIVVWGLIILRYLMQGAYRPDSVKAPQQD